MKLHPTHLLLPLLLCSCQQEPVTCTWAEARDYLETPRSMSRGVDYLGSDARFHYFEHKLEMARDVRFRISTAEEIYAPYETMPYRSWFPERRDGKVRTPLMLAAYTRSPETAQLLLGAGADTQARNKGNRPLIDYDSDATTARLILEHTPPALRSATATRLLFTRCNLAALALKAGASANARNKRGDTPLIYHCWDCGFYNAPLEPIRLLLEAGANPDAINSHGHTPLLMALWTERERSHGSPADFCGGTQTTGILHPHSQTI